MRRLSTILALLLTTVLAVKALAVPWSMASASLEHPAGCHENGGKAPSSLPAGYQCCQAGHSAAVVPVTNFMRPVLLCIGNSTSNDVVSVSTTPSHLSPLILSSSGPPGTLALRI